MNKLLSILCLLFFLSSALLLAQRKGTASYYSNRLKGRHTSDGGRYYPDSMTCAHLTYPFGTILKVKNPKNGEEVYVKVTDRGPHNKHLMIDLSYAAAQKLDIIRAGIAPVEITKIDSLPFVEPKMHILPIPLDSVSIKTKE